MDPDIFGRMIVYLNTANALIDQTVLELNEFHDTLPEEQEEILLKKVGLLRAGMAGIYAETEHITGISQTDLFS